MDTCSNKEEKLYFLGGRKYVQYCGEGDKPEELKRYIREHNGEFPPYMPLPCRGVEFLVGLDGQRRVKWPGRGKLPADVMEFVRENGALPAYHDGREGSM